jgi:hypothetical protein
MIRSGGLRVCRGPLLLFQSMVAQKWGRRVEVLKNLVVVGTRQDLPDNVEEDDVDWVLVGTRG